MPKKSTPKEPTPRVEYTDQYGMTWTPEAMGGMDPFTRLAEWDIRFSKNRWSANTAARFLWNIRTRIARQNPNLAAIVADIDRVLDQTRNGERDG